MSSTLAGFGRRFALKPYGDELLTRSADFWLFSARLIILTMAIAEALAWGYMGSLMSRSHPWIAAFVAGAFVFTLIWIIDATFMTLDLSRGFYERMLLGKKESPVKEKLKFAGGIAARVAIVSASLIITAPFLAQAIFAGDVQDEMARRNAGTVAATRTRLEQSFATRAESLRAEQAQLERQRVLEAAGMGPSGRYGRGPALETIELQLAEKRDEIQSVEAARAAALSDFDKLSRPELAEKYGLSFLTPGVQASGELLRDLLETPQFTGAELAIRAFLAFLFLGLLILKIFQPRSVAIYFNEQLHSVHDEWRKGLFDAYLPPAERASAGGSMDPLRFEDWCLHTYAAVRREDEHRRTTARAAGMHELLVEQWQRLEQTTRAEVTPLMQRLEGIQSAIAEIESEMEGARDAASAAEAELARTDASAASMREHLERGTMDGPTFERAMAASRELERRREEIAGRATAGARTVASCTRRLDLLRGEASALREEIASKQQLVAQAAQGVAAERLQLAQAMARQREIRAAEAG